MIPFVATVLEVFACLWFLEFLGGGLAFGGVLKEGFAVREGRAFSEVFVTEFLGFRLQVVPCPRGLELCCHKRAGWEKWGPVVMVQFLCQVKKTPSVAPCLCRTRPGLRFVY
jgi:hypothetical protein